MSEMEDKLNSILSNPQMMQQIMSMANMMNAGNKQSDTVTPKNNDIPSSIPQGISPSMLSKVSSIMQRGTIDNNQQSLLKALTPYLSKQKLSKLERAMHAAKMASIASDFVNPRGIKTNGGR